MKIECYIGKTESISVNLELCTGPLILQAVLCMPPMPPALPLLKIQFLCNHSIILWKWDLPST